MLSSNQSKMLNFYLINVLPLFFLKIERGPSEDVAKGKQLSDSAAEKQTPSCKLEVRANPDHHKFLIGKQGMRIKKVCR